MLYLLSTIMFMTGIVWIPVSGVPQSLPNADQNFGIDPNADQYRSLPLKSDQCGSAIIGIERYFGSTTFIAVCYRKDNPEAVCLVYCDQHFIHCIDNSETRSNNAKYLTLSLKCMTLFMGPKIVYFYNTLQ